MLTFNLGLSYTLVSLICWLLSAVPLYASNPQITTPTGSFYSQAAATAVTFAHIPAASEEIGISVDAVAVVIHRSSSTSDIVVSSNCPAHFNVTSNVITQVALSTASAGVSIRADATGAQALVNGHIYQLPRDANGAVHSLKIENGQVIINGQKLNPLPGSDVPGCCTGADVLNLLVPEDYRGGLILSCRGKADVKIDGWTGGNVTLTLREGGNLVSGKLSQVSRAVVDLQGESKAELKAVNARSFVANVNGQGTILVQGGSADITNATISGSGKITLKGNFHNLKKSVNGTGNISISQ